MFIVVLFIIYRKLKQTKYSLINVWVNNKMYTYMMKYYSAKKGINSDTYHNMNQF